VLAVVEAAVEAVVKAVDVLKVVAVGVVVGRIGGTKVPGTDCRLIPDVAKELEIKFDPMAYFK